MTTWKKRNVTFLKNNKKKHCNPIQKDTHIYTDTHTHVKKHLHGHTYTFWDKFVQTHVQMLRQICANIHTHVDTNMLERNTHVDTNLQDTNLRTHRHTWTNKHTHV